MRMVPQEFLSQEQISEYQGVFALLDKEGRGTVDFDVLKAAMTALRTDLLPNGQQRRGSLRLSGQQGCTPRTVRYETW